MFVQRQLLTNDCLDNGNFERTNVSTKETFNARMSGQRLPWLYESLEKGNYKHTKSGQRQLWTHESQNYGNFECKLV